MNLSILPAAMTEASLAAAWYDDRTPGLGDEFFAALTDARARIVRDPQVLPRWESYRGPHEIRRCVLRRFP